MMTPQFWLENMDIWGEGVIFKEDKKLNLSKEVRIQDIMACIREQEDVVAPSHLVFSILDSWEKLVVPEINVERRRAG